VLIAVKRLFERQALASRVRDVERTMIAEALRQSDGNEEEAVRRLCLSAEDMAHRIELSQELFL
jgi:DNA-binding NtrC family response regulator